MKTETRQQRRHREREERKGADKHLFVMDISGYIEQSDGCAIEIEPSKIMFGNHMMKSLSEISTKSARISMANCK
jgi:hypothetical protein